MTEDARLPDGLALVRTTPVFDESTVPAALLRAHRVATGVWGRLVVRTGALTFVFEDDDTGGRAVTAGQSVVIPPDRPHHLVTGDPVTFVVEFHRSP